MVKTEKTEEVVENLENDTPKEYELGFLLNPIISPEEVLGFVDGKIRSKIEGGKGEILGSSDAKMTKMSYPLRRSIENKVTTFRDAYFGSIKFKGSPELTASLMKEYNAIPEIIRFTIINSSGKNQVPVRPARRFAAKRPEVGSTDKPKEEMTEEAKEVIDKEIDELVSPASA